MQDINTHTHKPQKKAHSVHFGEGDETSYSLVTDSGKKIKHQYEAV